MEDEKSKKGVRGYCFTLNNYTEEDERQVMNLNTQYTIYGHEVCPTTGTPHLQGYVYLKDAKTMKALSKLVKRASWRVAKGTADHNETYCSKDAVNIYETGRKPKQGERSDIENARHIIRNGGGMAEVVEVASSYQSVRMAELYLKYHERKRDWKPTVYWFYGATGTGKSKMAYDLFPKAYTAMSTARWWDGYDAHSDVVIDDMRKDFCKFHELLRYLDRYAVQVETKGGTRQFLARNIVITSCYTPTEMFDTREDVNQLVRRIDYINQFPMIEEIQENFRKNLGKI